MACYIGRMRIGVFDSGLGGLFLMKPVVELLPQYDYVYLGDTKNLPYGDKSQDEIYRLTKRAVEFLMARGCAIVLLFCNTASAMALRRLQQEGHRALGIIIPTVEEVRGNRIGVLATQGTTDSKKYEIEIKKLLPHARVTSQAAPKLVPMIESGELNILPYARIFNQYLEPLLVERIDTLILGCTHYVILKNLARQLVPGVRVIFQDELIADKVRAYLQKHPEIESKLSRNGGREYLVTAHHPGFQHLRDVDRASFRLVVLEDRGKRPADG